MPQRKFMHEYHSIESARHKFENTEWIEELLDTTVGFFEKTK